MPEYVKVDEIKAGMILAEPVQNNFGQTMIPQDFTIEEKHLRMLKLWNITGAMIKKDGDDKKKELTADVIKKIKEKLESRMDWKTSNSIESNLFTCAIKHLAENE